MTSLIHTKNLSSPSFKIHDAMILKRDDIAETPKPMRKLTNPDPLNSHLKKETNRVLTLPNNSFSTDGDSGDAVRSFDEKLPFLSLPSQKSREISITQLYSSPNQLPAINKPSQPAYLPSFSLRLKSFSPTFRDAPSNQDGSLQATKVFDPSQTSLKSPKSAAPKKMKKKIANLIGEDKFQQYLGYLNAISGQSPKGNFEYHLRDKCHAHGDNKKPEPVEYENMNVSILPQILSPHLSQGMSLALSPKTGSRITLQHDTSRKNFSEKGAPERQNSIALPKKASILISKANETQIDSQTSMNTIPELRLRNASLASKSKPNHSIPQSRTYPYIHQGKQILRVQGRSLEQDIILGELAKNLQELYHILAKNNIKMTGVLDTLANSHQKILAIILAKFHKVNDYDAAKLEQKFAGLEANTEVLSIPMKLQKQREGITLIEGHIMDELGILNKKIEEYNILKKKEQLQFFEEKIIKSQEKLHEFQMKKLAEIHKGSGNTKGFNALRNFLEKDLNISASIAYDLDPLANVDEFQKRNGEFKLLDRKNVEYARNLGRLFSKWMKQPHENSP